MSLPSPQAFPAIGRPRDPSLALQLDYVEKRYGRKVHALKGVSLDVRRGEIFGLLGPNGAGKSTLVKILMTVVRPTRAVGYMLGEPVATKGALRRVGYLPENHRFPKYLTGRQTVDFFAALSGSPRTERRKLIPALLETVGMTAWADQKIARYSKGMMQRVGIAQALAADPDLIVLDEPTDGVDPVGRRDIRDMLVRLKEQGKTVFINSHLLSELEAVSDRVAIMVGGQVARQGTVAELAMSRRVYELELAMETGKVADFGALAGFKPEVLSPTALPYAPVQGVAAGSHAGPANWVRGALPGGMTAEVLGSTIKVFTPDPVAMQPMVDSLRAAGLVIKRLQPIQPSLEQLFMEAVAEVSGGPGYAAGAKI